MKIKTKTNNIIILGDYLRGYVRPKHAKRIKNLDNISGAFESLILNAQIYTLDNPTKQLGKKDLEKYIDEHLKI
jgi:hypothetical protein